METTKLSTVGIATHTDVHRAKIAFREQNHAGTSAEYWQTVENAFKHGISPTEPSFIHIRLEASDHTITCDIQQYFDEHTLV